MQTQNRIWGLALFCGALLLLFVSTFYADNKYQTPGPYGKDGVLTFRQSDLVRSPPLYLIDGWLLTDNRTEQQPTWIGEYSSLKREGEANSPHGSATYRLTLRYDGEPLIAAIDFPELYYHHIISLDGNTLSQGMGTTRVTFFLTPGDHLLTVQTTSQSGFYSGMYYPPALGIPRTLDRVRNLQIFCHALAFLIPLALSLFSLSLWRKSDDRTAFWFGLLCCFFSLYVAYFLVDLFGLKIWRHWFFVESIALYGLCFCVVHVTALAAQSIKPKLIKRIDASLLLFSGGLLALCLLIPSVVSASALHGALKNSYFIVVFCCVVFLTMRCANLQGRETTLVLAGNVVFGLGLLLNLFFSNRFEPIRFFWQFEWCGLLLVLLFGGMMVARNQRILAENLALTGHLEQLVLQRTQELTRLLHERKAFFADMAHDLKAPLFATKGFIEAIRANNTGIDPELAFYIGQVEQKQKEMSRRLQGLSTINELDRIETPPQRILVSALLQEVYHAHCAEAAVSSIHLLIKPPDPDCSILAQPQKLNLLFENLIYNAFKATRPNGIISIEAIAGPGHVVITVSDTGCGIPAEELPHVFRRFFVGQKNEGSGTGLGLSIVHSIVCELGGQISVSSVEQKGTSFVMTLPFAPNTPT